MTQQTDATTNAPDQPTATDGGDDSGANNAAAVAAQPTGKSSDGSNAAAGAPEAYEAFKFPEGTSIDQAALTGFQELAKASNLNQETAQKVLDHYLGHREQLQAAQAKQISDTVADWAKQSRADKEFGGAQFDVNVKVAQAALGEYGTKEFGEFLTQTGLGNHPEMIRFCVKVGKTLQEMKSVRGDPAAPARTQEEIFYPEQAKGN